MSAPVAVETVSLEIAAPSLNREEVTAKQVIESHIYMVNLEGISVPIHPSP